MLRFYMDHHVDAAITRGLRGRGVDCLTCEEDGTRRLDDERLLERAGTLARVLFSQDIDHYNIATRWMRERHFFAGLVFARQIRLTVGRAIEELHFIAHVMPEEEIRNNIVRIPL